MKREKESSTHDVLDFQAPRELPADLTSVLPFRYWINGIMIARFILLACLTGYSVSSCKRLAIIFVRLRDAATAILISHVVRQTQHEDAPIAIITSRKPNEHANQSRYFQVAMEVHIVPCNHEDPSRALGSIEVYCLRGVRY